MILTSYNAPLVRRLLAALLAASVFAIVGCGSPDASHPASPVATTAPRLVYTSDWSKGLADWKASAGWSVVDGKLQSTTGSLLAVTIPYTPTGPNFAVEAEIEVAQVAVSGASFKLTALHADGHDGFDASIYSLLPPGKYPDGQHPTASVVIDPTDAQDPLSMTLIDYEPKSYSRTYRVEIHDNAAVFKVDGHFVSSARSLHLSSLARGPLTLTTDAVSVRVNAIRVYAL